jgi:Phytanoyl-CoA dioxygenase (PhyH)
MVMFGPFHGPLLSVCRTFSRSTPQRVETDPNFAQLDIGQIVAAIEKNGAAKIGYLPAGYIDQIRAYCAQHNRISYWNPHLTCDVIERLSRNKTLLAIARKYLGAHPRLWTTQLRWTYSLADTRNKERELRRRATGYNYHDFHYDSRDFKSLTIFIYLTDVTMNSGPHLFIPGTHKRKSLREIRNLSLSDAAARQLYGNRIKAILGRKGTIFAEDTSCYHKAAECENGNRLIASFDYIIRKKSPSIPFDP